VRVLVAGSSGFIGSALVTRLRHDGVDVGKIVRSAPAAGDALYDPTHHELDCSRLPSGSLDGIDAIYALGGDPLIPRRWGSAKREAIRSSRVDLVGTLARAVAKCEGAPPALITISAVGIYGDRGEEELTESSPAGKGFVADLCLAWEHAAAPALTYGGRVVTARLGIVLGSGGMLAKLTPVFRFGVGGKLGNGKQWMSWISLDDAVSALVRFGTDPSLHGAYNLTAPNPVRNAEFTATLARALHRRAPLPVPRAVIVAATGRRVASEFLLQSARAHPQRLVEADFAFSHVDVASAVRAALADGAHP
jgi:uncharacterized protein